MSLTPQEATYNDFVDHCNEFISKQFDVEKGMKHISSPADEVVQLRRDLLGGNTSHMPTWQHLYESRLVFDLHFPEMFDYNSTTKEVSLAKMSFSEDDLQGDLGEVMSTYDRGIESVDAFLMDSMKATAYALSDELRDVILSADFRQKSIRNLFGIDLKTRQVSSVRKHLRQLTYTKRKNLVEAAAKFATLQNSSTGHHVTTAAAKQIYNRIVTERQHDTDNNNANIVQHPTLVTPPRRKYSGVRLNSVWTKTKPKKRRKTSDSSSSDEDDLPLGEDSDNLSDGSSIVTDHSECSERRTGDAEELDNEEDSDSGSRQKPFHKPTVQVYIAIDDVFADRVRKLRTTTDTPNKAFSDFLYQHPDVIEPQLRDSNTPTLVDPNIQVLKVPTMDGSVIPFILKIDNFLSEQMHARMLQCINNCEFIAGVGGRTGTFVRISTVGSESRATYFQISKNFYPSVEATEPEMDLLGLANKFLEWQNGLLTKITGNNPMYRKDNVNTLQIVVEPLTRNAGYGKHSDFGRLVNSQGMLEYATQETLSSSRLPFREEMQTLTVVLTTMDNKNESTHKLSFYDDQKHLVGSVETGGNTLHAQLHGSQLLQHEVNALPDKRYDGKSFRVVLSCRHTHPLTEDMVRDVFGDRVADNSFIGKEKYIWKAVLQTKPINMSAAQGMANCTQLQVPLPPPDDGDAMHMEEDGIRLEDIEYDSADEQEEVSTSHPTTDECTDTSFNYHTDESTEVTGLGEFVDTYKSIPPEHRAYDTLFRSAYTGIRYPGQRWKLFFAGDMAGVIARNHGCIPTVAQVSSSGQPTDFHSLFNLSNDDQGHGCRLLLPLEFCDLHTVASRGQLIMNNRAKPPTCGDSTRANTILLSKPYKNDVGSIVKAVREYQNLLGGNVQQTSDHVSPIYIYGSGGSSSSTTAYACNLATMNKYDASLCMPCPQDALKNAQNTTMIELSQRRGIVAVFLDWSEFYHFFPDLKPDNNPSQAFTQFALFLGYYHFGAYRCVDHSKEELRELEDETKHLSSNLPPKKRSQFLNYSAFRRDLYLEFKLKPVFYSKQQLNHIRTRNQGDGFSFWHVDPSTRRQATINIKESNRDLKWREDFISEYSSITFSGMQDTTKHDPPSEIERIIKGTKLGNIEEFLLNIIFISVASSMRYVGDCLYQDEQSSEQLIGPLPPECGLSSIYQAHPFPFPIRTYDIIPLLLRACAMALSLLTDQLLGKRIKEKVNEDLFFMSILNRLTGRYGAYACYRSNDKTLPLLPRLCEVSDFLDFVRNKGCLPSLFNEQHISAIPSDFITTFEVFREVVVAISTSSNAWLEKMTRGRGRADAINELGSALLHVFESHKLHLSDRNLSPAKYNFLSHQIVCDLEEVYIDPFGGVSDTSIVLGHGGEQGLGTFDYILSTMGDINGTTKKNGIAKRLAAVSRLLWEKVNSSQDVMNDYAKILGCTKNEEDGNLSVRINGRPIGPVDMEHFLCKLYIALSKTIGERANSKKPKFFKGGLHPTKCAKGVVSWDDNNVSPIMTDIIATFRELKDKKRLAETPELFLLPGEDRGTSN